MKSYKKFSAPLKRLEAVACDAELQEKPLAELKKLGEMLHERCRAYMGEHSKENIESTSEDAKGRRKGRGPSFKLGGVSVNAKTMMACEEELAPLDEVLPANSEERRKWTLDMKTKPANFDFEWDTFEDSKLLQGIYQYGMGSWEQIKMDPSLGIGDKILSNENKKPQAKHLQSRAEYLLKVLKRQLEMKKGISKPKRQRKARETKALTKEIIENDNLTDDEEVSNQTAITVTSNKKSSKPKREEETNDDSNTSKALDKKEKKRAKREKKMAGPMHFTANSEPQALDVLGDLDPAVFNECKEKMRPVKKALKALDNPDETLSEVEQVNHTRMCLLQIGEQINTCLNEYTDQDKIKEWRSNLWYFVSKFTEYDAKKLYKLYKKACKKSEKLEKKNEGESSGMGTSKDTKEEKEHHGLKRRHEEEDKEESTSSKKSHHGEK